MIDPRTQFDEQVTKLRKLLVKTERLDEKMADPYYAAAIGQLRRLEQQLTADWSKLRQAKDEQRRQKIAVSNARANEMRAGRREALRRHRERLADEAAAAQAARATIPVLDYLPTPPLVGSCLICKTPWVDHPPQGCSVIGATP